MPETYPDTLLPLPSVSFNVDADFSNVRSTMESGRVRQRPRFSREIELAKVTFQLDRFQYAAFIAFWDTQINRGTDWFNMNLPTPNGDPLTLSEVRFASDYDAQHRGGQNWDVSAVVEFREAGRADGDYYDAFVYYEGDMAALQADAALIEAEVTHFYVEHAVIEGYDVTDFQNQVADVTTEVTHYNAEHPAV